MRTIRRFLMLCVAVALVPVLPVQAKRAEVAGFPGWPIHFEGVALTRLPLTKRESGFYRDFPGKVARFSDGSREIILRWVTAPTRKLHPAADCFKGIGFTVDPQPVRVDQRGQRWGSFITGKDDTRLVVHERIYTVGGDSWIDVSSWYWAALLGDGGGPWWVATVAESSPRKEGV